MQIEHALRPSFEDCRNCIRFGRTDDCVWHIFKGLPGRRSEHVPKVWKVIVDVSPIGADQPLRVDYRIEDPQANAFPEESLG